MRKKYITFLRYIFFSQSNKSSTFSFAFQSRSQSFAM